jgi:hypothetical protein
MPKQQKLSWMHGRPLKLELPEEVEDRELQAAVEHQARLLEPEMQRRIKEMRERRDMKRPSSQQASKKSPKA